MLRGVSSSGSSATLAIGSTVTSATQNSVFFAGAAGVLAQNNVGLNWDDSVKTLTTSRNTVAGLANTANTVLAINGADAAGGNMEFTAYGATPAGYLLRLAAGTAASPTAVGSTATLGGIYFSGYRTSASTGFNFGTARLLAITTEAQTTTAGGTDLTINVTPNGSVTSAETLRIMGAGTLKLSNAASFTANATTATVLGSVGPAGASTTVTKWLTIVDNGGTTRYIPCF